MKLRSHYSATVIGIAGFFLSGSVQSSEARSLRTSHKIHITDRDFHHEPNFGEASSVLGPRQLKWKYDLNLQEEEGVNYQDDSDNAWEYLVALHFSSFALDPRCTMEIRDKDDELVSALAGMGSFWSEHIRGLAAKLILTCKDDIAEEPQFKSTIVVDEFVVIDRNRGHDGSEARRKLREEKNGERNLEICRDSELQNAQCFEATHPAAFAVSNSVVHMTYATSDYCTGWMVSPGLLMTAAHCLETEEEVMNTVYQFNYVSDSCESDIFSNAETYKAAKLEMIDKQSDYALVRMERNPGFKYGYLTMENTLPAVDDAVYIPQHPAGRDLELAIFEKHPVVPSGLCTVQSNGQLSNDRTCTLYGAGFKDFVVFCDTEGGSSGAPVISATSNLVVGMHHCGSSCENFAVPVIHIYTAVNGVITNDIATAVEPAPTAAPTAGATTGNETPVAGTPTGSAGSRLVPDSLGWTLGLFFIAMSCTIVAI